MSPPATTPRQPAPRAAAQGSAEAQTYLGLAAAARLCPSNRMGKPVHPATLTRWIMRGIRLHDGTTLRLAAKRFPGGWATTRQDLDGFIDRLTADHCGAPAVPVNTIVEPSADRVRALDRAEKALDEAGVR
jgi:hypothetical protein